jgi:predicted transcriptional regulator
MTQERLAARAQVAVSTVRKIETGVVIEPGYFTVMALIGVLSAAAQEPGREGPGVLGDAG